MPDQSASGPVAAEVAEATKGGERRPGIALMGLGLYSRGELGPALLKTKVCRFAGVILALPLREAREQFERA